jgi:hypothetical protein
MAQTWNGIVTSVIEDIEKIAAQWIEKHILMAAVTKLLGIGAGQEAQAAKNSAINVAESSSDAAVAAAATLAYYSAFAPEIAPAMAAAQYAVGMGFAAAAAFQQGGLVPGTGFGLLHGGEMVLPAALSQHVMETAAGGGGSGGDSHVHVHYSPTIHGSGADLKAMLSAHADHIGTIVQRQMRKGRLPSL